MYIGGLLSKSVHKLLIIYCEQMFNYCKKLDTIMKKTPTDNKKDLIIFIGGEVPRADALLPGSGAPLAVGNYFAVGDLFTCLLFPKRMVCTQIHVI